MSHELQEAEVNVLERISLALKQMPLVQIQEQLKRIADALETIQAQTSTRGDR